MTQIAAALERPNGRHSDLERQLFDFVDGKREPVPIAELIRQFSETAAPQDIRASLLHLLNEHYLDMTGDRLLVISEIAECVD